MAEPSTPTLDRMMAAAVGLVDPDTPEKALEFEYVRGMVELMHDVAHQEVATLLDHAGMYSNSENIREFIEKRLVAQIAGRWPPPEPEPKLWEMRYRPYAKVEPALGGRLRLTLDWGHSYDEMVDPITGNEIVHPETERVVADTVDAWLRARPRTFLIDPTEVGDVTTPTGSP